MKTPRILCPSPAGRGYSGCSSAGALRLRRTSSCWTSCLSRSLLSTCLLLCSSSSLPGGSSWCACLVPPPPSHCLCCSRWTWVAPRWAGSPPVCVPGPPRRRTCWASAAAAAGPGSRGGRRCPCPSWRGGRGAGESQACCRCSSRLSWRQGRPWWRSLRRAEGRWGGD